jgi:glycosyltransferase involved in cell wall biosynthesis
MNVMPKTSDEPVLPTFATLAQLTIVQLITRSDVLGGAQAHVRDLAVRLQSEGHKVTVLVGGRGPLVADLEARGIDYVSVPFLTQEISPRRDIAAFAQVYDVLRRIRPDLICAHTAKAGLIGRLAGWLLNTPVVFTAHGWSINPDRLGKRKAQLFTVLERIAGPLSAKIINVCNYEQELAVRHRIAPVRKMCVIHNGIHDIQREHRASPGISPPRIIMVARMERPKDHTTLIAALAPLAHYEWKLDLVGEGPLEKEIRQSIHDFHLTGRVSFWGSADWRVEERLASAQIAALISHSEGFPLSVLEAMRAGLPVVASNVAGVREAVEDGVTGFLVPSRAVAMLSERLKELITDPDLRISLGKAGRANYLSAFTFDLMYRNTLNLYNSAITPAGKPSKTMTWPEPYRLNNMFLPGFSSFMSILTKHNRPKGNSK